MVQADIARENKAKNMARFFNLSDRKAKDADLIVFPEMFSTGFTMNTRLAETMDGETVKQLQAFANEKNTLVMTSLIIKENQQFYNRLLAVFPDGRIQYYNKRHLFSFANEDKYYLAGKNQLIVSWQGWKIMPLVCYDLRFPVWSRNTMDYDLLVYVANWPERRRFAWQSLLVARAIENQCFTVGVNRIGKDHNDVEHAGDSVVLNPFGEKISNINPHEEKVELIMIEHKTIESYRKKFNFLADSDKFTILQRDAFGKN